MIDALGELTIDKLTDFMHKILSTRANSQAMKESEFIVTPRKGEEQWTVASIER